MRGDRVLRGGVATALFTNAFLMFVVQPHITKRLLPVLGGSAEVWIVCTLFFQIALLAGYTLAYLARRLPLAISLALHAALIGVAWLLWPFTVNAGPPAGASPPLWTLQLLLGQVGLLCIVLAATSPLLQTAYARAAPHLDPYPLFAASNAGSLVGLFFYPLLVEPLLTLDAQARAWSVGALLLLALLIATDLRLIRSTPAQIAPQVPVRGAVDWRRRLRWLGLSLVPSVLLLAVTAQITTDIAPVPLLWTLPLALYLGSFIRVFSQGWRPSRWTWPVLAVLSLPMLLAFAYEPNQWWWILVHLAILWCGCVICHGALVEARPTPDRLAEFYLWLALGGAVGGLLAGIVAPLVFDMRAEYPMAVLAVLWLAPRVPVGLSRLELSWPIVLGVALIGAAAATATVAAGIALPSLANALVLVPAVGAIVWWNRPRLFASCATAALLAVLAGRQLNPDGVILRGRSFYGTYSVRYMSALDARALYHGTTLHGLQSLRPEWQREPLSYYGRESPVGDVFRMQVGPGAHVALVGLGGGLILRFAQPGSQWTVYEIDPAIARVAQDPALFSHWVEAAVQPTLVIGDGRLRLADAPDGSYDLIVIDAFASDSIPSHLLTREALQLYLRKLRAGGTMLFHVSNRHIDLAPVLGATAAGMGLAAQERLDETTDVAAGLYGSRWVQVGSPATLGRPTAQWRPVEVRPSDRGWTDDYSNLLAVLRPIRRLRAAIEGNSAH